MKRVHWTNSWLNIAHEVSQRSLCEGAQVGTVITDKNNRVIATGYNGPPSGFDHENKTCSHWCQRQRARDSEPLVGYGLSCPSIHSEANALMFADRRDYEGGSMYVTATCCEDCAKLVANSGIKTLYLMISEKDLLRGACNPIEFLIQCGIDVVLSPTFDTSLDNDEWERVLNISYKYDGKLSVLFDE